MTPQISVIICTYKPQREYFEPCLHAVAALDVSELNVEVVLVDNNSPEPIENQKYVSDFIQKSNVKLIKETKQGLSYARIAGVANTTAPIVVFFDDDNAPASDYLQVVKKYFDTYSFLGILGPGNVEVVFNSPPLPNREHFLRGIFQEKHMKRFEYASVSEHSGVYPPGTGISMLRLVFDEYRQNLEKGNYKTTGRKGNSMTSSEDVQIVFTCVLKKLAVGTAPELYVKHLTPENRCTIKYVKRLRFGQIISFHTAIKEVLPEKGNEIEQNSLACTNFKFIFAFSILFFKYLLFGKIFEFNYHLAYKTGWYAGVNLAADKPIPMLVNYIIKLLKLN